MKKNISLIIALCAIFLSESYGKPTEIVKNTDVLNPVASTMNNPSETIEIVRKQRSPQFGLLGNDGDYSDYDDDPRHFSFGNKRKFHHHKPHYPYKPHGSIGGHGCRGYGCGGGWQPDYGGHYGGQGASFASASAGSVSGGGPYNGGHSGANAQSASFSVGPFSASFSTAQASSQNRGF